MKIVVCDDDALVYEQMKNIIASYSIVKNENLELTFYQTVEELLHAKHKYDILFLDIRFNNCDIGIDVAKKLRKAGNTSLIILLTSLHSKAIEGYEIGAYRYIVKPIIKEKMYAVLDEAISSIRSNYRVILVKDIQNVPLYHMSDSNFVADKERAINAVENDILLVVQNINGSIALIVSIIVLSVMVAQYDVLALVVLIIMSYSWRR